MNANKPIIPREVAEAIEEFRVTQRLPQQRIVRLAMDGGAGPSARALYTYARGTKGGFDTLLAALVNGYEIEKSAEELAHDKIRNVYALHEKAAKIGSDFARDYNFGIRFVLDTLGIKISGVNIPESERE